MVDPERVLRRLRRMDELLAILEELRARGREALLADRHVQLEAERALQLAIQACIDTGAHLVAELGLPTPDDYRDIFTSLGQAGLIDGELAEHLGRAAALRNILVHEYLEIDHGALWDALGRLEDLRRFAAAAARAAEESE